MFAAFLAVPVGWLAFGVLVLRELDESFADGYSAVVSLQNVWPRVDRRVFTGRGLRARDRSARSR